MGTKGQKFDTWQKRVVQEAVEKFTTPFTAKDLCIALAKNRPKVSRATIYRMLSTLCGEGRVREVSLPDGRRICANATEAGAMCIIECSDCGRLASCLAPSLGSYLKEAAQKQKLRPIQTAVYMRARCIETSCEYRRKKSALRQTRRKTKIGAS